MKINKIKVVSFAKFQGFLACLIGFICGLLYALGGLLIDAMVSAALLSPEVYGTSGLSYGTVLAFGALIGMPLIWALFGFTLGLAEAILYNLYVKKFGGVEFNFWR